MTFDEVNVERLKNAMHKIVETTLKTATETALTEINSLLERLFQRTYMPRDMKLEFENKISQTFLTGEEIKGVGDTAIEVALRDNCTGHVVDIGPESSARVEILLLKGGESEACEGDDWFNDNIVGQVEGKLPLLAGNVRIKLQRGIGVLDNIKFRNHTIKMNPPMFRLGARVIDSFEGTRVKAAKTKIFTVKDFRNKYNRKHDVPSLSDEVWRLQNIQKGGKIDERLQGANVYTVEHFLIQLLKNPEGLKRQVNLGPKKWEATMNHARTCSIDQRRYCYINFQQKTGIVFDLLGNVQGLILEGRYASTNMLSRKDKAQIDESLSSAFANWEDTLYFRNEIEFQHYLSLVTFVDPPNSFQLEHSTRLNDEPGPSEMTGKYGGKQLNSTLPGPSDSSAKELRMDGLESAHTHPSDGLHDEPRPSEMTGDYSSKQLNSLYGDPSAEDVRIDDMEIEQGHPPEFIVDPPTSLVTSVVDRPDSFQPEHTGLQDQPGPSGTTDESLFEGLEDFVEFQPGGHLGGKEFTYEQTLQEYPIMALMSPYPDFNYMDMVGDNSENFER